ncbi:MAG: N-acetylneuraminate synthase family protein [Holosporaceae bacterium]|jgi:N-acetylneuraminate synthase|nr:N-acetylneuraminate synthase family protein [Holosporaceae bacterium]
MNILPYSSSITIGKKTLSPKRQVYFIADVAANHDGDLERAKDLIYKAKDAGADCVKFQHFIAEKIVSDFGFTHLQCDMSHQKSWKKSVFDTYKQYEYIRSWNQELIKTANDADIEFMTTPYDIDAVNEINPYVNAYKIGSGDITWIDFLLFIANLGKPVILSTGASSIDDVVRAVKAIEQANSDIILLQCNTNYTASLENFKYVNLNVINTFKRKFPGIILGLSDHTSGCATVLGAISLGASVIEKHFTDDNSRVGPDHKFAMNPKTWREMIERSKELEFALGDGIKRVEENEKETVIVQRRCIRLNRSMSNGDVISGNDIEMLRPAPLDSYAPYCISDIIGKKLLCDVVCGDYLKEGYIEVF